MTGNILLIGGSGNIGSALMKTNTLANTFFISTSRSRRSNCIELDPSCDKRLEETVKEHSVSMLVLLSAISSVDQCNKAPLRAFDSNFILPSSVAQCAYRLDIPLVYMSSEYVYNGYISGAKDESADNIGPSNVYGCLKYASELVVASANPKALVLRIPKVYSVLCRNSILQVAISELSFSRKPIIDIASDQFFSPLSVEDLAIILRLINKSNFSGTFNCGGPQSVSRHSIYETILSLLGINRILRATELSTLNIPSFIPKDVSMNSAILYNRLGFIPSSFDEYALQHVTAID